MPAHNASVFFIAVYAVLGSLAFAGADATVIEPSSAAAVAEVTPVSAKTAPGTIVFVQDAARLAYQRTRLAHMALVKGHAPAVRVLGEVFFHAELERNAALRQLALAHGFKLALGDLAEWEKREASFTRLEGAAFDQAWINEWTVLTEAAIAQCHAPDTQANAQVAAFGKQRAEAWKEELEALNKLIRGGEKPCES